MPTSKAKSRGSPTNKSRGGLGDDIAYLLPMAIFLAFNFVAGKWKSLYGPTYAIKTVVVAAALVLLWKHYTKIRWNHWWLGIIVGVAGIFQWVLMQLWLQRHVTFVDWFQPAEDAFNPMAAYSQPAMLWGFVTVRIIGAVIVVPVMEELFWRDFLWRTILAPNNFKLAKVGEWAWAPFLIVAGAFATVHGNWWLTAIFWAAMVGWLLVYTKSLGACIIAHATTNLLLAGYVLYTHDWSFW